MQANLPSSVSQILNTLFPQSCFLCGNLAPKPVCAACSKELPYLDISIQSARAFKHVHHAYAVFDYVYPVNRLIQSAKFYNNLVVLHYLGSLMAQHLDFEQIPDVIIPVPLHIKRLRQRGYNQSVELAKMVRNKLKLPLNYSHCQRIRYTVPQVGLNGKARLTNLADAFAIKQWPTEWEHVLLIDDVLTTGTTVDEISKVLKSVGVKQITVWCCAARFTNE